MVSQQIIREWALAFPETDEHPHFHLKAYRVKKKIFCTLHEKDNRLMVSLSLEEQSVFCAADPQNIFPVPGGWGLKGSTFIDLGKVKKSLCKDAMIVAYCLKAPPSLAAQLSRK